MNKNNKGATLCCSLIMKKENLYIKLLECKPKKYINPNVAIARIILHQNEDTRNVVQEKRLKTPSCLLRPLF
jgi:hypothetical protein